MVDHRIEILNSEYNGWVNEHGVNAIYPDHFPEAYKEAALNAMDENGKRLCFDLLEYMANNKVECGVGANNNMFWYKGECLTRDQLFENFL